MLFVAEAQVEGARVTLAQVRAENQAARPQRRTARFFSALREAYVAG